MNMHACIHTNTQFRQFTFACELSIVFAGTFITAHDALDVLILVGTIRTVLRVLRGREAMLDEREIRLVFQRQRIEIGGDRGEVAGERVETATSSRVERVRQRVEARRHGVHQRRFAPRRCHQSHVITTPQVKSRHAQIYPLENTQYKTEKHEILFSYPKKKFFLLFCTVLFNKFFRRGNFGRATAERARIRALEVIGHPLGTL